MYIFRMKQAINCIENCIEHESIDESVDSSLWNTNFVRFFFFALYRVYVSAMESALNNCSIRARTVVVSRLLFPIFNNSRAIYDYTY